MMLMMITRPNESNVSNNVQGNMGGSGLGDTDCNVQGEYTMDFATRTYSGTNLFDQLYLQGLLSIMVKKSVSFYTPDA